ncbi:NAD(P)/FAD-dependent oxidoreductase [Herpetosiphon giganteus]|uniref:NAD(P)/FAD-dependent oxidoreductase n=1 Tax=Herpetosiphon giganteus TaxID=2029754 RepID=UPI001958DF83|nr:tryptophan 7-halogenase [Herpetosiphon giganteus]MBM7845186.1 flavin-dependent dehydrogenase [Herpetosiphon giganteus]
MSDVIKRIAALPSEQQQQLLRELQMQKMQQDATAERYDVVILGGGMAGLTLALQLKQARPTSTILVIEKQSHPVPEAAHKVGESSVEICAHYLRDILGLEEHLHTQQLRKFGLRMFFSRGDNLDLAQRVEIGPTISPPLYTYQVDRGRLENTLGIKLRDLGIVFLDGASVQQIDLQPQAPYHRLHIQAAESRIVITNWVVDASGRRALLKRQLGLSKPVGHQANAAWFRVSYPIDVNRWSNNPEWHARIPEGDRSLSTNHLMGDGYWVWLIRLASGSTSVGIVTDANKHEFDQMNQFERALTWLHAHEPQCAAVIEEQPAAVQDFRVMKNYSYSCQQVYSADRWCLIGEAGISLDPLYSPGGDMIAIGNTLACDLIVRNLNGEDIQARALIHDRLFLTVANIWLSIYEKQYSLMNNAQIMITKIIWDTAFYWGVFGLLFFHDTFRKIADMPSVAANLTRIADLSNRIQAFYREWHAVDTADCAEAFVDLYSPLDFMVALHEGMADQLSEDEVAQRFDTNVRFFERLAGQIISIVIEAGAEQINSQAMIRQIQAWQTEPYIAELISCYRRESWSTPINSSWIALSYQQQKKQEVL